MTYALISQRGDIVALQNQLPADGRLESIELTDEQAATIAAGRVAVPAQRYAYQNGELIPQPAGPTLEEMQQWMQERQQPPAPESIEQRRSEMMANIPLDVRIKAGESFVERSGYGASRLVTCMDLLLQAKEAGTVADKPKLVATYQWLQTVKGAALAGSISFPPVPFSFEEVISE